MKPDVIVILGGGLGKALEPAFYTAERLRFFIKNKKKFKGIPIIASGGYTVWTKKKPVYTEAQVMKHFLVKHGISPDLILIEEKSRDTIGNAYWTKQIVKRFPSWKNILVITTNGHVKRARWTFAKIFGKAYQFEFLPVATKMKNFILPGRERYENYIISVYKRIVRTIGSGDDTEIMKMLKRFHPIYSQSKQAKEIQKEIEQAKQKILGYTMLK
jgi:uncharacterized SAM-binding protein YcdF (DUF218 family)